MTNIFEFDFNSGHEIFSPFESPCSMLSAKSIHIYCSKENYSQSSLKHERYMCKVYEFNIPCTKGIIHSKALNFSLLRYYWTTTRRSKFLWENLKIRFFWWNPHSSIGGINFFLTNLEYWIFYLKHFLSWHNIVILLCGWDKTNKKNQSFINLYSSYFILLVCIFIQSICRWNYILRQILCLERGKSTVTLKIQFI